MSVGNGRQARLNSIAESWCASSCFVQFVFLARTPGLCRKGLPGRQSLQLQGRLKFNASEGNGVPVVHVTCS